MFYAILLLSRVQEKVLFIELKKLRASRTLEFSLNGTYLLTNYSTDQRNKQKRKRCKFTGESVSCHLTLIAITTKRKEELGYVKDEQFFK